MISTNSSMLLAKRENRLHKTEMSNDWFINDRPFAWLKFETSERGGEGDSRIDTFIIQGVIGVGDLLDHQK